MGSPTSNNNSMQRAKVYRLNDDGKWDYIGTGHATVFYLERSEEDEETLIVQLGFSVIDEDKKTLLMHHIRSDDIYRKKDTIISWRDPGYSTDLALSFQETTGCSYIWDHICNAQRNLNIDTYCKVPKASEKGRKPMVEQCLAPCKAKCKTTPIPLSREDITPQFGKTMKEAAENLNVSLSTLKRKCKVLGIFEWHGKDYSKRKVNESFKNQSYMNGAIQDLLAINRGETNLDENTLAIKSNSSLGQRLAMENPLATFRPGTVCEGNSVGSNIDLPKVGMKNTRVVDDASGVLDMMGKDGLPAQDSFGRRMNYIMTDSSGAIDDPILTPEPMLTGQESLGIPSGDHHGSHSTELIFNITDVSPAWALSGEETKILVVGIFQEKHMHLMNSNLFCVCGDVCVQAEIVQPGVFRCMITPQIPGVVNLFISSDGHKPISQVMAFKFRTPPTASLMTSLDEKSDWQELEIKMRLAHLLFSTSKSLTILLSKIPQKTLEEAMIFRQKTRHIVDSWDYLVNAITEKRVYFQLAKNSLMELTLQNRLLEWLLEKVLEGGKIPDRDEQGQGVIHLCAILDYNWAIYPYSWSGLSLDFRDKFGWTALHWAAHHGRQRMVASLLSARANPNLVTDPTPGNPSGCTPADLASKSGYEGLAAYLAEKSLVAHFEAMTTAGNVSGSLRSTFPTNEEFSTNAPSVHVNEEEQYLKDTLAAYRTATDAAARIQAAFREQSFKLRTKEVESSNTEDEARSIIAAMRIQHAFRNHETKKQMAAAARIQYRIQHAYRTATDAAARIQAAFREQSFKLRTKEVESSNTEDEARSIIAAMRIQHAFRNHETKKQMAAAARIQYRFRTWKMRKDFLNKRRQVIKIQAIFQGHQVRRQYTKIVWSVGVLEKAILRWRLKRRGFRGLQVDPNNVDKDEKQENDGVEEFFHASRKQAEERVERSVVRVQAMFRSKRAQEEYRKMKLQHIQASVEYNESFDAATDMEK